MRTSSLRTELLVSFAILTAAALMFALASVVLFYEYLDPAHGTWFLVTLTAIDVAIFVAFLAYMVQHHIVTPLHRAVQAAEAIAAGDLHRRVTEEGPREFRHLARSFNRMTDRLLDERAHLVRAEKLASVGRLAAGVAHEIGNPLGAITGYTHVLRRRAGKTEGAAELLEGLERETTRIDRIIRGLLDYSRPRSATPTLVDVNEAVRAVADLLTMQGVLRRVEVDLTLSASSPVVYGQFHELEQALVNLLINAADAMSGQGRLVIHTERLTRAALQQPSTRRELTGTRAAVEHAPPTRVDVWLANTMATEIVKIVIADSGAGIDPALSEKIFDPFFTTKEPGKGTGLGLAIVSRVIDNLGGTIWVTSAREGGAAFHLLLPSASGTPNGAPRPLVGAAVAS